MAKSPIAVIGAGQMGRGIAQVFAQAGHQVFLADMDQRTADSAKGRLHRALHRLVDKGKLPAPEAEQVLDRIVPTAAFADLHPVSLAVEAVTENLQTKLQIFEQLDEALGDDAILASNTSSISLTKLAARTRRPDRVVGMHFMNPVPLMHLVEVVRALQTSDETHRWVSAVAEDLGKTVVTTKDMPGFIVNRMLIPFLNEACFALQEGLGTAEDVDAGARLGLNHPMGPFELADLIGLDTVLHIAEVLHREFGDDKYRPPTILRNYVAAGWLGRKSGRGFYEYDSDGKRRVPRE